MKHNELPELPKELSSSLTHSTAPTLLLRTRERNFLIKRLRGMSAFASHLGLSYDTRLEIALKIEAVQTEQICDKYHTTELRKAVKEDDNNKK